MLGRFFALALTSAALSGCVDGEFRDGHFLCEPGAAACPAGLACAPDGRCRPPGATSTTSDTTQTPSCASDEVCVTPWPGTTVVLSEVRCPATWNRREYYTGEQPGCACQCEPASGSCSWTLSLGKDPYDCAYSNVGSVDGSGSRCVSWNELAPYYPPQYPKWQAGVMLTLSGHAESCSSVLIEPPPPTVGLCSLPPRTATCGDGVCLSPERAAGACMVYDGPAGCPTGYQQRTLFAEAVDARSCSCDCTPTGASCTGTVDAHYYPGCSSAAASASAGSCLGITQASYQKPSFFVHTENHFDCTPKVWSRGQVVHAEEVTLCCPVAGSASE